MKKWLKDMFMVSRPPALSFNDWAEWEANAKKNHPIKYFISETIPDKFNEWITFPFNNIRQWFRYRFFDRYHIIDTKLPPDYHEVDTRLMHGMFSLLVDFVEIEKAWMQVVFDNKARYNYKYPWWSIKKFKSFRHKQAGLDNLKWEMTLDSPSTPISDQSPSQAAAAREIWELYHWWTRIRPIRPDPNEISGWGEWIRVNGSRSIFDPSVPLTAEQHANRSKMNKMVLDIEDAYDKEDEEMMIRIIKIRRHLWT